MRNQNYRNFKENGYYVIKKAISNDLLNVISNYYHRLVECAKLHKEDYFYPDAQVPDAYTIPSNERFSELNRSILNIFTNKFNKFLIDEKVHPTFSYSRYYLKGNILSPHTDVTPCELSATLTIDFDKPWPIFIKDYNGKIQKVTMDKGDVMLYHGCDLQHWREELTGEFAIQIFLHYVTVDNPNLQDYIVKNKQLKEKEKYIWSNQLYKELRKERRNETT